MTTVWVLDRHGYDARGGCARVFSSQAKAKAAVTWVTEWEEQSDGWIMEQASSDLVDCYVIYPVLIDAVSAP